MSSRALARNAALSSIAGAQAVKQALHKRRVRLEAEGRVAPKAAQMLHYVIHVSPDSRKARRFLQLLVAQARSCGHVQELLNVVGSY